MIKSCDMSQDYVIWLWYTVLKAGQDNWWRKGHFRKSFGNYSKFGPLWGEVYLLGNKRGSFWMEEARGNYDYEQYSMDKISRQLF